MHLIIESHLHASIKALLIEEGWDVLESPSGKLYVAGGDERLMSVVLKEMDPLAQLSMEDE